MWRVTRVMTMMAHCVCCAIITNQPRYLHQLCVGWTVASVGARYTMFVPLERTQSPGSMFASNVRNVRV